MAPARKALPPPPRRRCAPPTRPPPGTLLALQVAAPVTGHEEQHAPGTVNLWTGRVLKEYRKPREGGRGKREVSQYRCHPRADAGWTRGAGSGAAYCCLYFARGIWWVLPGVTAGSVALMHPAKLWPYKRPPPYFLSL